MSKIIQQILADYPDQSPDDLTLNLGQWAESNKRNDIFEQHPDFAAEYTALRNEIRRAQDTRGSAEILGDAFMRGMGRARQGMNVFGGVDEQDAQDIANAQTGIDSRPISPSMAEFNEAPDTMGSLLHLAKNPMTLLEVTAESLPQSAASIGTMAAGSAIGAAAGIDSGPGAFLTAAVGAGLGSGAMEYASTILDVLQQEGMDINSPESIQSFFSNEGAMNRAREKASLRGVAVGTFDGLTAGMAGRFISPLKEAAKAGSKVSLRALAGATGKELGMQMAGGAVGEGAAEDATGDPLSPKNIALEALAEIASSPGEIISNLSTRPKAKPPVAPDNRFRLDVDALNSLAIGQAEDTEGVSSPVDDYIRRVRGEINKVNAQTDIDIGTAIDTTDAESPFTDFIRNARTQPPEGPAELDAVSAALASVKAVQDAAKASEAARAAQQEQDFANQEYQSVAAQALAEQQSVIDQQLGQNVPAVDANAIARSMVGDTPDFRAQEEARRIALSMAGASTEQVYLSDPDYIAAKEQQALIARITGQNDVETSTAVDTTGVITPFDETVQVAKIAASIDGPKMAEQMAGVSAPPPAVETIQPQGIIEGAKLIRSFEPGVDQSARLAEIADFAPKSKSDGLRAAAIILDNETGQVFQRGIYQGKSGELMIEAAQTTKGASTGKGQSRSADADFIQGTTGRKLRLVQGEQSTGGSQRYSILGYTAFEKPQAEAALNLGSLQDYNTHPEITRLAKIGFEQSTAPKRSAGRRIKAKTGVIEGSAKTGDVNVVEETEDTAPPISIEEAEKVADEAAEPAAISSARVQFIDTVARTAELGGHEQAVEKMMKLLAERAKKAGIKPDPIVLRAAAERMVEQATSLTRRASPSYLMDEAAAGALFQSALAGARRMGADVVVFEKNAASQLKAAQEGWGIITTEANGQKLIALGVESLTHSLDATVKLLHETAHLLLEGSKSPLDDRTARAFHQAIALLATKDRLWLNNPLSTDIRLLANSDPATLSAQQRAILSRLTPEEVAQARSIPREELLKEQAAEHLAMLGVDKATANTFLDRLFRVVKDVMLRVAIAMQQAFKGEANVDDKLIRAFVENKFLQAIHGEPTGLIPSFRNLIGAPAQQHERVAAFSAMGDGSFRMSRFNPLTGNTLLPEFATHEAEALREKLEYAIANAEAYSQRPGENPNRQNLPEWAREEMLRRGQDPARPFNDFDVADKKVREMIDVDPTVTTEEKENLKRYGQKTPPIESMATLLTKRAYFSASGSYTPTVQFNAEAAAINLQDEILVNLFKSRGIGAVLTREPNPMAAFLKDIIGLPESQTPEFRRAELAATVGRSQDPLTGKPVSYSPATKLEALPSIETKDADIEGRAITDTLSSAQDYAIRQSLRFLYQTQSRISKRLERYTDRYDRLKKRADKKTLSEEGMKEMDELARQIPTLKGLLEGDGGLVAQAKRLESKLGGADDFVASPGASFFVPKTADADEASILRNSKTIPRDLQFANKDEFYQHIVDIRAWLANPANLEKGRIYGYLQRVADQLQDLAVTPDYVASTFTLRKTWTDSIVAKLRDIGTPLSVRLSKMVMRFQSVMVANQNNAREAGAKWNKSFHDYAVSMGTKPTEAFVELHWNHLMRALESINEGEGNPVELAITALNKVPGLKIVGDKQRAALRDLILATIENERLFRKTFNELGLKVSDPDLKDADGRPLLRRLITQGYATGRRSASKHLVSLYNRMNPVWSETTADTFLDKAGEFYSKGRAAYDAAITKFFPSAVIRDFVDPLATNNVSHFSITDDGEVTRPASAYNVRTAWQSAKGDITKFAESLHRLEGLKAGDEARTVQSVISSLQRMFAEIKRDADARIAAEAGGMETTPRQMMDARLANNWPAEWVSYGTYDSNSNLVLLHQLAINSSFGRNGFSQSGEFGAGVVALNEELRRLKDDLYQFWHDGLPEKEIEKRMGVDRYRIAKQADDHLDLISNLNSTFQAITKTTGYLLGDFKLFNDLVGTSATLALQNPRSALTNSFDVINAPFTRLKLSTPALKSLWRGSLSLLAGGANSFLQAFGSNFAFNADLAKRRAKAGVRDPDARITWAQKMTDRGYRFNLSQPDSPEGILGNGSREAMFLLRRARDLTNVGAQNIPSEQALGPKLRPGLFATISQAALDANVDSTYQSFFDLAMKGVDYIERSTRNLSPDQLSRFLFQLESGSKVPTATEIGYDRKWLVLNDEAAYAYLKDALETKMYGERGVGPFIVAAWRRKKEGGSKGYEPISNAQFRQIANLSTSEWSIQSSVTSAPPWIFSSPMGRAAMTFLTFPWSATQRFFSAFRDPRGRIDARTVADGAMAMMIAVAPLTVAGSLAFDWYDEKLLKKKQNLRELNVDQTLPLAVLERMARYGTAGFASEIVNQVVNFDTAKNLSLDSRIFVVNQMRSMLDVASTVWQQEGSTSYGTVFRPAMQAIGLSGVLHYSQLLNAQLGLTNQESAVNERINSGNYLRSAGRVLDLDVRIFRGGASSAPTPATPWLHQMELAATTGDNDLFRVAYQKALRAAREMDKEDPAKYVADAFADRHPLRRIFKTTPSDYEYRRMLGVMGDTGKEAVSASVNSFNRYLQILGKDAYTGRAEKNPFSPEQLIRQAQMSIDLDSL